MNNFVVEATNTTPFISVDYRNGHLAFRGRSSPQNVNVYYRPVYKAVKAFENAKVSSVQAEFNFDFFNTATARAVYTVLRELKSLVEKGIDVSINWVHDIDAEEMLETGRDLEELTKLPFQFSTTPLN